MGAVGTGGGCSAGLLFGDNADLVLLHLQRGGGGSQDLYVVSPNFGMFSIKRNKHPEPCR